MYFEKFSISVAGFFVGDLFIILAVLGRISIFNDKYIL
jgi:hypothetical protein